MLFGVIIKGTGGLYVAKTLEGEEFVLRCKGKFRRMHVTPMVGDMIDFTPAYGDEHGWVEEIRPRKTVCVRPPVANAELMVMVIAPAPAPDLMLVDKMMISAFKQEMTPVLAVNKCDLDEDVFAAIHRQYQGSGMPVLRISAKQQSGLESLRAIMQGKITCFAGQSGVGKSTLINALIGMTLKTGDISQKIQRGKHTTRHAELIEKDGLLVLDTPGFSLMELSQSLEEIMEPAQLQEYYPEVAPYLGQCKFSVCYHDTEPQCAVKKAEAQGLIDPMRMERYRQMLAQVRKQWRERND